MKEPRSRVSEVVSQLFLSGSFARFTFLFRYNVTWNMSSSPELSEPTRTLKMQHSELKIYLKITASNQLQKLMNPGIFT